MGESSLNFGEDLMESFTWMKGRVVVFIVSQYMLDLKTDYQK